MKSGSGTNLKMLDFMVSEIPVLSTPVAARGLDLVPDENFFQSELQGFKDKLKSLIDNQSDLKEVAKKGKELVQDRYDWSVIADKAGKILTDLLPQKSSRTFSVDLSIDDNLGEGWYPPEYWEDNQIVRWTDGHGVVFLERASDKNKILLSLMPGSFEGSVEIFVNGEKIFDESMVEGWNNIEFEIPSVSEERLVINFISPTWSPHEATKSPDTRILGVAVKEISFM